MTQFVGLFLFFLPFFFFEEEYGAAIETLAELSIAQQRIYV